MKITEKNLAREGVVDTIREFFKTRGFKEVQTPILVPIPSCEANLEPFKTLLRRPFDSAQGKEAYLIMSPEYSLKKLLAGGLGNIFEITRVFRNQEEVSRLHNPEFTMLEWYRTQADYRAIMNDFEELFIKIIGGEKLVYQGEEYDLKLPWPRISFAEAFARYGGRKIEEIKDEDFYQVFFNEVEPQLRASHRPAFVYDYPAAQAALARKCPKDPRFAERWEVFIAGIELGNCFSELTDPVEQRKRFEIEIALRQSFDSAQDKAQYPMDEELLAVLDKMPECAGIAVGVDRLVMLAADAETIGETLFFPAGELFGMGVK